MSSSLPDHPALDHPRHQARDLQRAYNDAATFHRGGIREIAGFVLAGTANLEAIVGYARLAATFGYHTQALIDVARIASECDRRCPDFMRLAELVVRRLPGALDMVRLAQATAAAQSDAERVPIRREIADLESTAEYATLEEARYSQPVERPCAMVSRSRCSPCRVPSVDRTQSAQELPMSAERIVPRVPGAGKRLRLLIDSDVANEIDDLYAIALALAAPGRFDLQGFVATHFAASAGPDSTEQSYQLLGQLLRAAGCEGVHPATRGGDPMLYGGVPSPSEGAELIIEQARAASPEDPLWVVVLGAATNTASAILQAPEIMPRVRVVFHSRCARLWPERTEQFNVVGDVPAVQTLLASGVPLVWFDTGTQLTIPYEETARRLAPLCATGRFLHEFRDRRAGYASRTKGFFDMGDIAWLIDPTLCQMETVPAPTLRRQLAFDHGRAHGNMLRVTKIDVPRTWELFFHTLASAHGAGTLA